MLVVPLSILGGVVAALKQGRLADRSITISGLSLTAVPEFVTAIVLIILFGIALHWLPVTATAPAGAGFFEQLKFLLLPALWVLAILGITIFTRGVSGKPLGAAASTVFGVLYTGGMLSFGYAIRYHDYVIEGVRVPLGSVAVASGGLLLLLPLLLTWASDIGAFFVGRAFGKRKLMPSVSPGKTVAGAIGGLVVTVIVGWLYTRFVLAPTTQLAFVRGGVFIFGFLVSVAAQVGDLAESLLKREAGMKDSSHIIPGHGGVLDRFDSLLFVLPVSYVLFNMLLVWAPTR